MPEPDLDFIDPKTGEPFTKEDFTAVARDYLGTNIISWACISPGCTSAATVTAIIAEGIYGKL